MLSLFIVDELPTSGEVDVTGDEARHAISAMRIQEGELISLTDGCGAIATAEVKAISRKTLTAKIIDYTFEEPSPTQLTVLQALTKGDRARETVELLTEAGVDQIIPWSAQRSIGQWKDVRESQDKWRTWAREATKQSRRTRIPEIDGIYSTSDALALISKFDIALLFHESDGAKLSTIVRAKKPGKILIIIGPEGGISEDEIQALNKSGAVTVGMGRPVFRSAHAGAAALAAVQTALEIW